MTTVGWISKVAGAIGWLLRPDAEKFDAKIERDADRGALNRLADEALKSRSTRLT